MCFGDRVIVTTMVSETKQEKRHILSFSTLLDMTKLRCYLR